MIHTEYDKTAGPGDRVFLKRSGHEGPEGYGRIVSSEAQSGHVTHEIQMDRGSVVKARGILVRKCWPSAQAG